MVAAAGRQFLLQVNEVLRTRGATAFVCECGANGCDALVDLPVTIFDGIRADGGSVLAEGHAVAATSLEGGGLDLREDELAALRESLRARVTDVWERLNDAVSELHELHGVPREEIVDRVDDALEGDD